MNQIQTNCVHFKNKRFMPHLEQNRDPQITAEQRSTPTKIVTGPHFGVWGGKRSALQPTTVLRGPLFHPWGGK